MTTNRPSLYLPTHPLATRNGKIAVSRKVLFEKMNGHPGGCHWCGIELSWATTCADHLNSVSTDNRPENLVPSCRGCNANREDGTGHGRRPPNPPCEHCGAAIVLRPDGNRNARRFCSIRCANLHRERPPRAHGTEWNYQRGCRCDECREARRIYRQTHK